MPKKTSLFSVMEGETLLVHETNKLKDMLRRALPYLQGYDLMGTGGCVSKEKYTELNDLEKEIAEVMAKTRKTMDFTAHMVNE